MKRILCWLGFHDKPKNKRDYKHHYCLSCEPPNPYWGEV